MKKTEGDSWKSKKKKQFCIRFNKSNEYIYHYIKLHDCISKYLIDLAIKDKKEQDKKKKKDDN